MNNMLESLSITIKSWIVAAVTGNPIVFFDRPLPTVESLPRYCIIGPLTDNDTPFLGSKIDSSRSGELHELTYDIEVWSKNGKEAITQMDKIHHYILDNRNLQEANFIHNVAIIGMNYRYESEVKIHRRILTIRVYYLYDRS